MRPTPSHAAAVPDDRHLVAELRADTLEAFDKVLSAIRLIQGISNTETSLLLTTDKA
jgi:hypothetical protein